MPNKPSQQIHLCNNRNSLHRTPIHPLRHDSRAIPLKKPAQRAQRRVARDLDKATPSPPFLLRRGADPHVRRLRHHLAELAEVEHDVRDGRLRAGAAGRDVAQQVAEGDEADEAHAERGGDGELVEAFVAHGFDGVGAGGRGGDRGDGFEAQGADGGAVEGIVLGEGCGRGGPGLGGWGEKVVGGEPVVVDELGDIRSCVIDN